MKGKREQFVTTYGGIYEHSPWVAEEAFDEFALTTDINQLPALLASKVDAADDQRKLTLIRAHPDLAGRAAVRGELTTESMTEQSSAGIDQCSQEEYERFQGLNEEYKRKYSFPFVMAVRDSNREEILAAFESRLRNDHDTEFATAIAEIHKIARLRLEAIK